MSLGLFNLNKSSSTSLQIIDQLLTFPNSVHSKVMLVNRVLIELLGFVPLFGCLSNCGVGVDDELFVNGNEVLEFGSLWVEGVFEVVGGD